MKQMLLQINTMKIYLTKLWKQKKLLILTQLILKNQMRRLKKKS